MLSLPDLWCKTCLKKTAAQVLSIQLAGIEWYRVKTKCEECKKEQETLIKITTVRKEAHNA